MSGNSKYRVIDAMIKVSVKYFKKISKRQTSEHMSEKDHRGGEAEAKSFPTNRC